jgi:hypothetical protein
MIWLPSMVHGRPSGAAGEEPGQGTAEPVYDWPISDENIARTMIDEPPP